MSLNFGKKKHSLKKIKKKGVIAKVVDSKNYIIEVKGNLIELPKNMVYSIEELSKLEFKEIKKMKILDPENGVLDIKGKKVKIPFNFSKGLLSILNNKKSKKKSRKSKKKSKSKK
jgi:hypothetical protein